MVGALRAITGSAKVHDSLQGRTGCGGVARLVARDLRPGGEAIVVNGPGDRDRTLDGAAASVLLAREATRHGLAVDAPVPTERSRIDRFRVEARGSVDVTA